MSKLSHFLRHAFGQETYEALKARATEAVRAALQTKVRAWLVARLRKAGLSAAEAEAIAYELIGRALAAVEE